MNVNKKASKPTTHIFLTIFCVILWFIGFTYNTGIGKAYDVYGKAQLLVFLFYFICIVFNNKKYTFNAESIAIVFTIIGMIFINDVRKGVSISEYIWVWLLIPIMKIFDFQKSEFKLIGFAFGVASIGVLFIGNITSVFAGWDGNSVSMVQFFSYTIFMASLSDVKDKKNIIRIVIFSIIYLLLINTFGSRSAQLFSIIMLLCMLSVIPLRKIFSKQVIMFALLFPLIIAVIVVLIKDLPFVTSLNAWSLDTFDKTIFNGRDVIWDKGIQTWLKYPFIGNGNMSYVRYHNSAVSALVGAGGIGYIILISTCYKILTHSLKWIDDSVVYGLSAAFLIVWMQQSVELGIIAREPNVIPYMILGLLYARINTLESGRNDEIIHNNSNI